MSTRPAIAAATTRATALRLMRDAFGVAGLETPDLDARWLLCGILGIEATKLITEPDVPLGEQAIALDDAVARRLAREPVSRILGWREFYGRRFEVTPATLDPRPDSETIIEAVLAFADRNGGRGAAWRLIDVGTGSGCLLVTLLCELPRATGLATDVSREALETAQRNADALGVTPRIAFQVAAGLDQVAGTFDILVSNPPYIPTAAIADLAPEVRAFDPALALDGGTDGLTVYRALADKLEGHVPAGFICLEVGAGQADAVARLLRARRPAGALGVWRDLSGHSRCVTQITHR